VKEEVEEVPAEIELETMKIEAPELEGPKIIGRIVLPVETEGRTRGGDEKRKRKRIPIEKKEQQGPAKQRATIQQNLGGAGAAKPAQPGRQGGGGRFTPTRGGGGSTGGRREVKEIDEKEIQNKIRETQAKLAGSGGRGKSLKAKYRRAKRDEMSDGVGEGMEDNKLQLTEFISVSELANLMDVSFADVISKCMSLGIMVSINQRLDAEGIKLVAG